jgi:cell division protein FtsW
MTIRSDFSRTPKRLAIPPPSVDLLLLAAILALTAIGAVMVYSASAITAAVHYQDQFYFLKRQLAAACVGLTLMVFAIHLGRDRIEQLAYPLLGLTFLSMLLVLVPGIGRMAGGACRWIDFGLFSFQPAEAAKVTLVLYLAHSLAKKRDKVCLLQRDLGTAVVLVLILFTLLFTAGARISTLVAAGLCAVLFGWKLLLGTGYRAERLKAFLDPFGHRQGAGFQLVESLLGIGNGGWLGQGLGEGKGKLFYLPAAHNDFIASVIAEEAGLIGVVLILVLYGIVVWRGIRASVNAPNAFGCYAALGLTTLIVGQALLNLMVVFALIPTKGLTLPFVSYGGSSLFTLLAASGLLLSVSAGRGGFLRRSPAVRLAARAQTGGSL